MSKKQKVKKSKGENHRTSTKSREKFDERIKKIQEKIQNEISELVNLFQEEINTIISENKELSEEIKALKKSIREKNKLNTEFKKENLQLIETAKQLSRALEEEKNRNEKIDAYWEEESKNRVKKTILEIRKKLFLELDIIQRSLQKEKPNINIALDTVENIINFLNSLWD